MMSTSDEGKEKLQVISSSPKKPLFTDSEQVPEEKHVKTYSVSSTTQRKGGGWKAMPYILGNETCERLASFGLMANFMVYLRREYHMNQVFATNVINVWSGLANFAPLLGAFISDTYAGRFFTIAFASTISLLGMVTMTLTSWLPHLRPPPCTPQQHPLSQCKGPTGPQLGVLLTSLALLSIGSGGIRPCSIPFGVDQFDPTTEKGRKGISSFFNWYYTSFTIVLVITQTVIVYVQDSVSWVLGFGIPTVLMFCSIVMFLIGTKIYVHVKPEGSVFSGIVEVPVAAYKKRRLKLDMDSKDGEVARKLFYDPPLKEGSVLLTKLSLTNQFRFLNKAALIQENDLNPDGTRVNKWNLSTIQQIEELKCLIRTIPIWASGILSFTSMTQQWTFTVSQAMQMNRHLGPSFQIPPGSIGVISLLIIAIFIPIYDRYLVPSLRKITKLDSGITLLQRIGIGIVFSILCMIVAGLIERERRHSAILHPSPLGVAPMSVLWLAPQLILIGMCEAFNIIGQIEFFNKEFPEHMRSIANSCVSLTFGMASYVSGLLVTIVHSSTKKNGVNWLSDDLNKGRLDYFYYVIAGLGILNLVYFVYCANRYCYKGSNHLHVGVEDENQSNSVDLELSKI